MTVARGPYLKFSDEALSVRRFSDFGVSPLRPTLMDRAKSGA